MVLSVGSQYLRRIGTHRHTIVVASSVSKLSSDDEDLSPSDEPYSDLDFDFDCK